MAEGLPRNAVACIVPGPGGVIWLCTSEGLAQFDGYEFRTFGPDDGLPSRVAIQLLPSRQGGYWLTTDRGVCRIAPGSRIGEPCPVLRADSLEGEYRRVFESENGTVWVATSRALYRVAADGQRLERADLRIPAQESIITLADGRNGAILVATDMALYESTPAGVARNVSAAVGAMGAGDILPLASGDLLLGTTAGLYRMDKATYTLRKVGIEGIGTVHTVLRRHDGTIWISGDGGVCRLGFGERGEVQAEECYTERDGLPSGRYFLTEDAQGDLWGTTEASGIYRIANSGAVSYMKQDGLGEARILSIFEDRLGRLCVMTGDRGLPLLSIKAGDAFQPVAIAWPRGVHTMSDAWNQLAFQARNREWWFASGQGAIRFPRTDRVEDLIRAGPAAIYGAGSPLGCADVYRLFEDSGGNTWIACRGAEHAVLSTWERASGHFHRWTAEEGWPTDATVNAIREGAGGVIWFGTYTSVVRFRGGRFTEFPLNDDPRAPIVRDMLIDGRGSVWAATQRAGLLRCDNPGDERPVFRAYTVKEGMSSNSVRSIVQDREGFIYAGTVRAVDRIDPRLPFDARRIQHLTAADGLPAGEHNVAFRDGRGHLWFGTLRGLAELDPGKAPALFRPAVRLTRLRVRGQEIPLPWGGATNISLNLAASRNQVEVEYTSVDLRSVASLRYQYRLNGLDSRWSASAPERTVNFASLPAGRLRFEVRAVDPDGLVSAPAAADLLVQAPVWRRWWFFLSIFALLVAMATALYNYRVRHLLAMERLRTRIATDLHDDIGASLSQISILSEVARRGSAPHLLGDIAEMARGMVQEMSDIVWAVNPRHDHFNALAHRMRRFASDTLGGANIDVRFDMEGLPPDYVAPLEARRPLYLVFKEAVNNVARHSRASEALVRMELSGSSFRMTVTDNGRGFDTSSAYAGEGLASIARRMQAVGGSAVWESMAGGGTRFVAVLPLHPRRPLREAMPWQRTQR